VIIHNIDPVAFTIGVFEVRYYGLVYFLGFLFAYFFLRYQIKKARIKHMGLDDLDLFMIYFMLGSILGSRIFDFIFYNPQIFFSDPLQVLRIWQGGMSVHGGIIGAVLAGLLFIRNKKIKFYDLADKVIVPFMFFLGLGRIANFINGELWGTRSDAWFCIDYTQSEYIANPPRGCRHPYQLYESVKNFAVGTSLLIYSSLVELKSGLLFWYGILFYNVLRFFLDFYRAEPALFLGISMGQFLCVVFSLVAVVFIIKIKYNLVFLKKDLNDEKNHKHKKRKKH
jgi:phosphatidylglycerol---prolipoprotein diacylglyceryl transferase